MYVIVSGDRHWKDRRKVWKELYQRRQKLKLVIEGGAKGADTFANECAKLLGIQTATLEANWDKYHRAAGPIRNQAMLQLLLLLPKPRLVLAFHKNLAKSKGTRNMVSIARKAKVRVIHVK